MKRLRTRTRSSCSPSNLTRSTLFSEPEDLITLICCKGTVSRAWNSTCAPFCGSSFAVTRHCISRAFLGFAAIPCRSASEYGIFSSSSPKITALGQDAMSSHNKSSSAVLGFESAHVYARCAEERSHPWRLKSSGYHRPYWVSRAGVTNAFVSGGIVVASLVR